MGFALKLIFYGILAIIILVVIIYAIGLIVRMIDAIKHGVGPTTEQLFSPLDNLYAGSIGLFK